MNHPIIAQALATQRVRDRIDRATSERLARGIRRAHPIHGSHDIVIREALPEDAGGLAVLDDALTPDGRTIVAVVDGQMVAAAGRDGLVIADPFISTHVIVRLLDMQASQTGDAEVRSGRPQGERPEPSWPECRADPSGAAA